MSTGVETKRKAPDFSSGSVSSKRSKVEKPSYAYLETIDRKKLDFDFEKVCSVTLSPLNVYCCLVCGKYFQGRHENSQAFLHSVNESHRVFINMNSLKVYLLPDGINVTDRNEIQVINSIRYAIEPTFTKNEIRQFPRECWDLSNNSYINGFVSVNNVLGNECANVSIILLAHIIPIRDYCLLLAPKTSSQLLLKLSLLIKKIWSVNLFKQHISIDEFLTYVAVNQGSSFVTEQDPRRFLLRLIDSAAKASQEMKDLLMGNCQGEVEINETPFKSIKDNDGNIKEFFRDESKQKKILSPFWCLSLDLPQRPLFKDGIDANALPQIQLTQLLKKFDGTSEHQLPHCGRKYSLKKLPKYLILHFDRFDRKEHTPIKSRNQTLIEFPMVLEFEGREYCLLSNIVHESEKESSGSTTEFLGVDEKSHWKIQTYCPVSNTWLEIDRYAIRPKNTELLFLNESYIQVWKQKID